MANRDAEPWDRHRIKAEVERRGYTLKEVALEAGLSESACRVARFGKSAGGARALSRFLGVPVSELFPGYYLRMRSNNDQPATPAGRSSRQKRHASADKRRASA